MYCIFRQRLSLNFVVEITIFLSPKTLYYYKLNMNKHGHRISCTKLDIPRLGDLENGIIIQQ